MPASTPSGPARPMIEPRKPRVKVPLFNSGQAEGTPVPQPGPSTSILPVHMTQDTSGHVVEAGMNNASGKMVRFTLPTSTSSSPSQFPSTSAFNFGSSGIDLHDQLWSSLSRSGARISPSDMSHVVQQVSNAANSASSHSFPDAKWIPRAEAGRGAGGGGATFEKSFASSEGSSTKMQARAQFTTRTITRVTTKTMTEVRSPEVVPKTSSVVVFGAPDAAEELERNN